MNVRTDIKAGIALGDAVEDIIHITGLDRFAKLYTQITGKDCCCNSRKEKLNQLFPYRIKTV